MAKPIVYVIATGGTIASNYVPKNGILVDPATADDLVAKIPEIYQYPLFDKHKQHIINTPKKFIKDKLNLEVNEDPCIEISDKLILETIKNIWKIEELRNRILVTLGILAIYRLGSIVVIPGVDPSQLSALQDQTSDGLL